MKTQIQIQAESVAALLEFEIKIHEWRFEGVRDIDRFELSISSGPWYTPKYIFTSNSKAALYRDAIPWMQERRYHGDT